MASSTIAKYSDYLLLARELPDQEEEKLAADLEVALKTAEQSMVMHDYHVQVQHLVDNFFNEATRTVVNPPLARVPSVTGAAFPHGTAPLNTALQQAQQQLLTSIK